MPSHPDPSTVVGAHPGGSGPDLRAEVPALTIIWHQHAPQRAGETAALSAGVSEISRRTPPFDSRTDAHLSRSPFLVVTPQNGGVLLRRLPTATTIAAGGSQIDDNRFFSPLELQHGIILTIGDAIVVCLHRVRTPRLRGELYGLVGGSDAIEHVRQDVQRVGKLAAPVLIRGETGTGKDMVARAIAELSPGKPFLAINMASIPVTTAAAELFGHAKGAFTGAVDARTGYFVDANGGTLFLDEIGATPPLVQPLLLRALETKEIQPLGTSRIQRVSVRVIAATDANLDTAIAQDQFAAALLHRLAGYQIVIPPLRQRREDIGALALHFMRQELAITNELHRLEPSQPTEKPWLSATAFTQIAEAHLPGNVRQLHNIVRQIVISSRGRPFATTEDIFRLLEPPPSPPGANSLSDDERLERALNENNFNLTKTAKALGIHRSTLYDRLQRRKSAIRSADDLTDEEVLAAYSKHDGDIVAMAAELRCSPKPLRTRLTIALKRRDG